MACEREASFQVGSSQSPLNSRNESNVIKTSLWGGILKGNKLSGSVTFQKRNPSRALESWRTPSSIVKSLKRPNFEECLPTVLECMHTQLGRNHPSLISKTQQNFPLDLSFDRSCQNPFGDFSQAGRSHWKKHIFIWLLLWECCQQRENNGQRTRILIVQPRGLKVLWLEAKRWKGN